MSKTCRLCFSNHSLVNSHIIPEAFFREVRGKSGTFLISSSTIRKRAPIGPYERMLCNICEGKFGKADAYAIDVLIKNFDNLFVKSEIEAGLSIFRSKGSMIDQQLLHRFFVSVLWRASVSNHVFYEHVSLGALESYAAEAIDFEAPLSPKFSVAMYHLPDESAEQILRHKLIANPYSDRMDGINGYHFHFGRIAAFITADSRGLPASINAVALNRAPQVSVIGGTFMAEFDRNSMQRFIESTKKNEKKR